MPHANSGKSPNDHDVLVLPYANSGTSPNDHDVLVLPYANSGKSPNDHDVLVLPNVDSDKSPNDHDVLVLPYANSGTSPNDHDVLVLPHVDSGKSPWPIGWLALPCSSTAIANRIYNMPADRTCWSVDVDLWRYNVPPHFSRAAAFPPRPRAGTAWGRGIGPGPTACCLAAGAPRDTRQLLQHIRRHRLVAGRHPRRQPHAPMSAREPGVHRCGAQRLQPTAVVGKR